MTILVSIRTLLFVSVAFLSIGDAFVANPMFIHSTSAQAKSIRAWKGGTCLKPIVAHVSVQLRTDRSRLFGFMMNEMDDDDDDESSSKKGKKIEGDLKTRLVSESMAPFRALRLFLYFSLGSGAVVGGLINLSGTIAGLSGAREDFSLRVEALNLAIDFGAAAVFAFLAKFEFDKQRELDDEVGEKLEKRKAQSMLVKGMKEREKELGRLEIDVQVSLDGTTRQVPIRELQVGAKQNMIIVVGPKKACKDALVGANLLKMDFAMSNVLVVTYPTDVDPAAAVVGFGERPTYETQPYVATPAGDGWDDYANAEMADAIKQNGEKAKEEGIVIVVSKTGKVIRRGIGKIPWRQLVEELQKDES